MKLRSYAVAAAFVLAAGPLPAHEVANMDHTHAFEQKGYGTYRQGHSVNNQTGDIIIWSPKTYTGYQQGPAVRFARPEPITQPPGPGPHMVPNKAQQNPARDYGKNDKRDYGD